MARVISVRAIVIDDDEAVCRRVSSWLREAAYDVVTFAMPDAGVAHIANTTCQLGLVDLRLNGASGIDVIAALRTASPGIRVVAMTAFPDPQQIIAAMRAGAQDLLEKPIQRAALLEALDRQLAETGMLIRTEAEFHRRLGARIRALRVRSERTLGDVSEYCGMTIAQLSQIELGHSGTTAWGLARIAGALNVPLDRLLASI